MDELLFAVGVAVVLLTGASILFALVLPRSPRGFERLSLLVNRVVRLALLGLSRLFRSYEAKDAVLAPTGPVALVAQLLVWAGCLILGFAFMLYSTTGTFTNSLSQATVSLFAVGAAHTGGPRDAAIDI